MEDKDELVEKLVQLSRLAMTGREQDIHMYVRRIARWLRKTDPDAAEKLNSLLTESPTRQSPWRSEAQAAVPVDSDSRLQLVRQEFPVSLDREPIWREDILQRLCQIISEQKQHNELQRAGLFPTRSILFVGAPGVGKTLAARWLASKLQRPLLTLDLSAVMSSFLGRTGNNVRFVLDYAKGVDCVLLLDEFDAIAKRRDDTAEIGELKRLVAVLLQEIDDWPPTGILVAATNHPGLLDHAIWRRFDMVVEFPSPANEEIRHAVELFLDSERLPSQTLDIAAASFDGLSFSDIERELLRVRRQALVAGQAVDDHLLALAKARIELFPKKKRQEIATRLWNKGVPQRTAHDLTGVSRDTIRKASKDSNGNV